MEKNNLKRQPLISVVMPVYNAGKFLKPAINSILNQTHQRFELIIVDDASTDNTPILIQQYKKTFPTKIKIVTIPTNLNGGGDKCANEGIKISRGKYIARMDADDIAHKTRLEKQVAFLETNPNVFLVGSNAHVINAKGKIIGEKLEPSTPSDIYHAYFTFHPLIHPTCMFRSVTNGNKFAYRLAYSANNDYLTFFTLICRGAIFVNLPEKLLYYRIHDKNDTFVHMKKKFMNTLKIRFEMFSKYGYRPSAKSLALNLVQASLCLLLPEQILFNMYLVSRGIINKKIFIPNIKTLFTPASFKLLRKVAI